MLLLSAIRADFLSALFLIRQLPLAEKGRTGSDLADETYDPDLLTLQSTFKRQRVGYTSTGVYDEELIDQGVFDNRSSLNRWEADEVGDRSMASSESSGNVNITFNRGQVTTTSNVGRLSPSDRALLQASGLVRASSSTPVLPTVVSRTNDDDNELQSGQGSVDGDQHDTESRD